ncbi:MAG: MATE family efflux transporter [Clostridiales Family XIII bacterium]|jgi:putative MATE family efflux protein|nr:MATE family efflux transporter [Clostridiales Family XIII bacterium]
MRRRIRGVDDIDEDKKIAENRMGVQPVGRLLASMSLPAMASMLIQALYNIVDSVFVSRLSESALTAVTLVFPVQMLMVSVAVGGGVGISSLIARRLGQKRFDEANDAAVHGYFLGVISWLVFAAFGIFGTEPFIRLFTSDEELISLAVVFCRLITVGSVFVFIGVNTEKVLQATGNTLFPMIFNIAGAFLNIALNPILIFGLFGAPRLGIAGSATATLIAQFTAMSIGLFMMLRFKHPVKIKLKGFRVKARTVADIYSVGLPSIIMQAIMSVVILGLNAILIGFSSTAVAVLGLYFRVQSLIFMPVFGLNQGALPIMGYNFGARKKKRLLDCYLKASVTAVVIMAVGMAAFQVFSEDILRIYDASPAMMHIGVRALRIISLCFVPAGFSIVSVTLFQALGHGFLSMVISIVRQLALILPFAWLLARFFGVDYVWFAYPLAEAVGLCVMISFVRWVFVKDIRDLG